MTTLTVGEQALCSAAAQGMVENSGAGYSVAASVLDALCMHTGAPRLTLRQVTLVAFVDDPAWKAYSTPRESLGDGCRYPGRCFLRYHDNPTEANAAHLQNHHGYLIGG